MPNILTPPSPYYHEIYSNNALALTGTVINLDFNLKDYDDVILETMFKENVASSQQADRLEAHVIASGNLNGVFNSIQQLATAVNANQLNSGVARLIHQTSTGSPAKETYFHGIFRFKRDPYTSTLWRVYYETEQTPDHPTGTTTEHVRGGGVFLDPSNLCDRIVINLSGSTGIHTGCWAIAKAYF